MGVVTCQAADLLTRT